jgi:hypothetical protein
MARDKVDFRIVDYGAIFVVYPNTRRARRWVEENLPQDHVRFADASLVGLRFIDEVTDGMRAADLDIEFDRVPLAS